MTKNGGHELGHAPSLTDPPRGSAQQQRQQLLEQRAQAADFYKKSLRKQGPAVVTRVVGELLVFVEFDDGGIPVGLVFKPDKISGYRGHALREIGVYEGATLSLVEWTPATRLVDRVVIYDEGQRPIQAQP